MELSLAVIGSIPALGSLVQQMLPPPLAGRVTASSLYPSRFA